MPTRLDQVNPVGPDRSNTGPRQIDFDHPTEPEGNTVSPDHIDVINAYEALAQLLNREGMTAKVIVAEQCVLVELPGELAVRAFHPAVMHPERINGHWVIEFGHARDDRQRGYLHGRPAMNFASLVQVIGLAIMLIQLQAYPEQ